MPHYKHFHDFSHIPMPVLTDGDRARFNEGRSNGTTEPPFYVKEIIQSRIAAMRDALKKPPPNPPAEIASVRQDRRRNGLIDMGEI